MLDGEAALLEPVLGLPDELLEIGEGMAPVLRRQRDRGAADHLFALPEKDA
jgi:hypothetical protein